MSCTARPAELGLNAQLVGKVYPAYIYEVSREKIREYAAALGETDPRYFSEGDDCVAPPTFAAAFTVIRGNQALFADPQLGAHEALVHGNQRYEYGARPVAPGDRLICTPTIADITERAGNDFLTTEVECRFADDDTLAVRSSTTLVFLDPVAASDSGAAGEAGTTPGTQV